MPTRKLVRDKKPELPWWKADWVSRIAKDSKECEIYLIYKIDEEVDEVLEANKKHDKKAVQKELWDVYEIVCALGKDRSDFCHHYPSIQDVIDNYWFSLEDIQDTAEQKALSHGRFDTGILLDLDTVD